MNRRYPVIVAVLTAVALAAFGFGVFTFAATQTTAVAPGNHLSATCQTHFLNVTHTTAAINADCQALPPTATATSVPPTATVAAPTATVGTLTLGWHAPGAHDGLNVHEHGDAPPQWVLDSGHLPFTQTREAHTGYKGVYAVSPGGVESYFIAHILSSVKARGHGDHDYQLWLRDPETGAVTFVEGVTDFGSPPPLRTVDTGERPIILSVNDGGCETWYSRPGSTLMDIGWTICGRYENFAGTLLGGVGTFRTIDWAIPCDRLAAGSPLLDNCRVEFGVNRLRFIVNSKDYGAPGIAPLN